MGFDAVRDEAFRQLVLARIIEPTSKADTVRVLEEIGVTSRTRETFMRCLSRVVERGYRDALGCARSGCLRSVGSTPRSASAWCATPAGSRWRCTCSRETKQRPRP